MLAILVFLSATQRAPLGFPADPTSSNFIPRPEWYFLFFFQLLKYFPGWLEPVATTAHPALHLRQHGPAALRRQKRRTSPVEEAGDHHRGDLLYRRHRRVHHSGALTQAFQQEGAHLIQPDGHKHSVPVLPIRKQEEIMKLTRWPRVTGDCVITGCLCCRREAAVPPTRLTPSRWTPFHPDASASFWANAPKIDVATKDAKKDGAAGLRSRYRPSTMVRISSFAPNGQIRPIAGSAMSGHMTAPPGSEAANKTAFRWRSPCVTMLRLRARAVARSATTRRPMKENGGWAPTAPTCKVDMWQWQSAQTNPMGQADDQYWAPNRRSPRPPAARTINWTAAAPRLMHQRQQSAHVS